MLRMDPCIADLERAGTYYADLGWRKARESQPGITFYQLRGQVLGLFPLGELAKDQGREGAELGFGFRNLAQNLNSPEEVDTAYAEALAWGGSVVRAP